MFLGEQIPRANAKQLGGFGLSWTYGFHLKVMFVCLFVLFLWDIKLVNSSTIKIYA